MPIWTRIFIDRIGMTIAIGDKDYFGVMMGIMDCWVLDVKPYPNGKVIKSKYKYTTRYDYYSEYKHKATGGRKIVDITFGYRPTGPKVVHLYITLTLYPSQFRGDEFARFKELFDAISNDITYEDFFNTARVNYLELAVDSLTHENHSFIPDYKYAKGSRVFHGNNNYLGTLYLGSPSSNIQLRIYDKRKQLIEKGKAHLYGDMHQTRFEAAMRRLGIPAAELINLKNPFEKLSITDIAKAKGISNDVSWQAFLEESQQHGVPSAFSKYQKSRKKYRYLLSASQVNWWNPKMRWVGFDQALLVIKP
ncbi:MAG: replication initiation factor domain-containing protein [Burkholderiales bacterium]